MRSGLAAMLVAWLALTPATAADITSSAKYAGAFVNWGERGREFNLRKWEDDLNQPRGSALAVDFYAHAAWSDFADNRTVPLMWQRLNPNRNLVWSFPLTVKGTPLAEIADGQHDADFAIAARTIADTHPRAIIRLGWEMNSVSTPWFAKGQEQDYIRAFRHVVGIFRHASPRFKFDWCPAWGLQDLAADRVYPGDDVVDYIGLDVYDFKFEGDAETRWRAHYLDAPYGLTWHRDFAASHGKKMSFPEWGVGQFGDNPYFIQQMHDWFVQNDAAIAYAAYFNVDGDWPTELDTGHFPQSQALFLRLFRRAQR